MSGMRMYVVEGRYVATKAEAVAEAQRLANEKGYDVPVENVYVSLHKVNVLRMLNVEGGHTETLEVVHMAKPKLSA